jgi:hypothetical protein
MPTTKRSDRLIHKIYRRNYTDLGMFFHVNGQRGLVPAISVEKAMYNYFKFIGEEDFNIESSIVTYYRIQKEFNQSLKNETT